MPSSPNPELSDTRSALKLAAEAALTFWLFSILGGTVAIPVVAAARNECGGPEWGGCFGVAIVFALPICFLLGAVAALSYGIGVLFLRQTFAGMNHSHRVVCSALTVLAVLVVGYFLLPFGPSEGFGRILLLAGLMPFPLSLVVIPAVSRLRGAGGDEAPTKLRHARRDVGRMTDDDLKQAHARGSEHSSASQLVRWQFLVLLAIALVALLVVFIVLVKNVMWFLG